jgi:hypothetical protein
MSRKREDIETPAKALKNDFARQRWELFHRAIAHAKQTNDAAAVEPDSASNDVDRAPPILSIVR